MRVVVTGAFSYTGKYITMRLLEEGREVKTLTGHPHRPNPFHGRVTAEPFSFDDPDALARSLRGAGVLVNTYWVRFPYGGTTYEGAVANSLALIRAALSAGVRRIVHISIANASEDSPYPYYSGKGRVERAIRDSGLSYAIVRPTVLFGHEGILLNNIAWFLRRFPLFAVPGDGSYRLQPVHVEDVADLAAAAARGTENAVTDAAGPEVYAFDGLVRAIRDAVGGRARIVHMGARAAYSMTRALGRMTGDVILTRDEIDGLMDELLLSGSPPAGKRLLSEWLAENADTLGREYFSELKRHYAA